MLVIKPTPNGVWFRETDEDGIYTPVFVTHVELEEDNFTILKLVDLMTDKVSTLKSQPI